MIDQVILEYERDETSHERRAEVFLKRRLFYLPCYKTIDEYKLLEFKGVFKAKSKIDIIYDSINIGKLRFEYIISKDGELQEINIDEKDAKWMDEQHPDAYVYETKNFLAELFYNVNLNN